LLWETALVENAFEQDTGQKKTQIEKKMEESQGGNFLHAAVFSLQKI